MVFISQYKSSLRRKGCLKWASIIMSNVSLDEFGVGVPQQFSTFDKLLEWQWTPPNFFSYRKKYNVLDNICTSTSVFQIFQANLDSNALRHSEHLTIQVECNIHQKWSAFSLGNFSFLCQKKASINERWRTYRSL